MEILSVDYMALMNRAKELAKHIDMVEGNIKDLNDVTKDLNIFWDGEANNEFVVAIGEDVAKTVVLLGVIRQTIKLIIMAINEYQTTEKVIKQIIEEI